jgi:RecJ-like exonuclease
MGTPDPQTATAAGDLVCSFCNGQWLARGICPICHESGSPEALSNAREVRDAILNRALELHEECESLKARLAHAKDQAARVVECPQCQGEGEFEHHAMPLHTLQSECPEYAVVTCEECDGKGVVPVEEPGDYLRDRLLNIATICEAKGLHVEAAGLRDTANIVSEQFRKWIVQ